MLPGPHRGPNLNLGLLDRNTWEPGRATYTVTDVAARELAAHHVTPEKEGRLLPRSLELSTTTCPTTPGYQLRSPTFAWT